MTNSTKQEIDSPVGKIVFMALKTPIKNNFDKSAEPKKKYTIRLEFDGDSKEDQEFRALIKDINPKRIVTTKKVNDEIVTLGGNKFQVAFSSEYKVDVVDTDGTDLIQDFIPELGMDGEGTAIVNLTADFARSNAALKVKAALYLKLVRLVTFKAGTATSAKLDEAKARINAKVATSN